MYLTWLPFIGFFIGLIIVSLGGGGGAMYVGILSGLCGLPPDVAASTSLVTAMPTTLAGTLSHWRAGNVNFRLGLCVLAGALPGIAAGTWCSTLLPAEAYRRLMGFILLALAVQMAWNCLRSPAGRLRDIREASPREKAIAGAYGVLGGALCGLLGVTGGGPVMAAMFALGCPALQAVGTSVFVILGMTILGSALHWSIGNMDWAVVRALLSGTLLGALAGPWLLSLMDRNKVNAWLRPVIVLVGFALAFAVIGRSF